MIHLQGLSFSLGFTTTALLVGKGGDGLLEAVLPKDAPLVHHEE